MKGKTETQLKLRRNQCKKCKSLMRSYTVTGPNPG